METEKKVEQTENFTVLNEESPSPENNELLSKEKELLAKITDLENKLKEYEDMVKRKVADFENFKKRAKQEKDALVETLSDQILLNFLPIWDNLERALNISRKTNDFESLVQGIQSTCELFEALFARLGVTRVDSVGKEFDPRIHHALQIIEGDYEKKIVLEETEKAFLRNEKVLRTSKALVGVPKKKEQENAEVQETKDGNKENLQ